MSYFYTYIKEKEIVKEKIKVITRCHYCQLPKIYRGEAQIAFYNFWGKEVTTSYLQGSTVDTLVFPLSIYPS